MSIPKMDFTGLARATNKIKGANKVNKGLELGKQFDKGGSKPLYDPDSVGKLLTAGSIGGAGLGAAYLASK